MARSPKFRFALVASQFNREYTDALLHAAHEALKGHDVIVVRVPERSRFRCRCSGW